MNYEDVLKIARERLYPHCNVCPVCNGVYCKGKVPGLGARGSGRGFIESVKFLSNVKIHMDCIYENKGIDTSVSMFGHKFDIPVFIAPIGGMGPSYGGNMTEDQYTEIIINGAKESGIIAFTGDGPHDIEFEAPLKHISAAGGFAIPTMKPWNLEKAEKRIRMAEKANAVAIACDIDSIAIPIFMSDGQSGMAKGVSELREIINLTKLPFIIKGIMTPSSAVKACEAGAYAIVVSNHGGRFIEDTPATFEMLPQIKDAVGDCVKVLVDGGVRSGEDIFKVIALGADAVLIGRPYSIAAFGGEIEGVKLYTERLKEELRRVMALTASGTLKEITRDKIMF